MEPLVSFNKMQEKGAMDEDIILIHDVTWIRTVLANTQNMPNSSNHGIKCIDQSGKVIS